MTPTGEDLQAAVDALLAGRPPLARQVPSVGCNIKWRAEQQVGPQDGKRAVAAA